MAANSSVGVSKTSPSPSRRIGGRSRAFGVGAKSSTRNNSGTSTCLGVSPPRNTLSELAITSTPKPRT
ncbi:Uncharacterised protein [Mycobacterium tuberculosis]|nr:Uncharacterised protein [Mycobacterium tuberculosis]